MITSTTRARAQKSGAHACTRALIPRACMVRHARGGAGRSVLGWASGPVPLVNASRSSSRTLPLASLSMLPSGPCAGMNRCTDRNGRAACGVPHAVRAARIARCILRVARMLALWAALPPCVSTRSERGFRTRSAGQPPDCAELEQHECKKQCSAVQCSADCAALRCTAEHGCRVDSTAPPPPTHPLRPSPLLHSPKGPSADWGSRRFSARCRLYGSAR